MIQIKNIFYYLLSGALLAVILSGCDNPQTGGSYRHPAEFEPSASTRFIWTTDFYDIVPKIAATISKKDNVVIYIDQNNDDKSSVEKVLKKYNANLQNISLVELEKKPQNAWLRDYGPVYLVNEKGDKRLVNFLYFGRKQTYTGQIAEIENYEVIESNISSTGGAREVNGKGTLLLVEVHELEENKPATLIELEQAYKQALNVEKVIWLKRGIPQDDKETNTPVVPGIYPNGVNGHIDEFCRFANDSTILISYVNDDEAHKHPYLAEAQKRLNENYQILLNSTDQDGKKFRIVRVPFAPLQIIANSSPTGSRYIPSVTSYMNFIITNSYIILPSYLSSANEQNHEEYALKEQEVEKIFQQEFPSKEIIKVQAFDLNRFSGGLHCVSIHEPLAHK